MESVTNILKLRGPSAMIGDSIDACLTMLLQGMDSADASVVQSTVEAMLVRTKSLLRQGGNAHGHKDCSRTVQMPRYVIRGRRAQPRNYHKLEKKSRGGSTSWLFYECNARSAVFTMGFVLRYFELFIEYDV